MHVELVKKIRSSWNFTVKHWTIRKYVRTDRAVNFLIRRRSLEVSFNWFVAPDAAAKAGVVTLGVWNCSALRTHCITRFAQGWWNKNLVGYFYFQGNYQRGIFRLSREISVGICKRFPPRRKKRCSPVRKGCSKIRTRRQGSLRQNGI